MDGTRQFQPDSIFTFQTRPSTRGSAPSSTPQSTAERQSQPEEEAAGAGARARQRQQEQGEGSGERSGSGRAEAGVEEEDSERCARRLLRHGLLLVLGPPLPSLLQNDRVRAGAAGAALRGGAAGRVGVGMTPTVALPAGGAAQLLRLLPGRPLLPTALHLPLPPPPPPPLLALLLCGLRLPCVSADRFAREQGSLCDRHQEAEGLRPAHGRRYPAHHYQELAEHQGPL